MSRRMKCFHVNEKKNYATKTRGEDGVYRYPAWLHGHMLTNKAMRDNDRFATLFAPDGTRANQINHSSFKQLNEMGVVEHVYLPELSDEWWRVAEYGLARCDTMELIRLKNTLRQNPNFKNIFNPKEQHKCPMCGQKYARGCC